MFPAQKPNGINFSLRIIKILQAVLRYFLSLTRGISLTLSKLF
jgi:hypothetical protein